MTNLFSAALLASGLYLRTGEQYRYWWDPATYGVFRAAAYEGISTFVFGTAAFNTPITTMYYEFFGSILCYVTGLAMLFAKDLRLSLLLGGVSMAAAVATYGNGGIVFATLVIGVVIARIYADGLPVLRWPILATGLVIAIICTGYDGYSKPVGFYAFMDMPESQRNTSSTRLAPP